MITVTRILRGDLDPAIAGKLSSVSRIAWDIETSGLDPVYDKIATVQLHAPEFGTALVQILQDTNPARLCGLLEESKIQKVFHHAMFVLRFMVAKWNVRPIHVACTKVASKLLAPSEQSTAHTLQSLLAEELGVHISKTQRLSNWLAEDLSADQVSYASADVQYLLPLLDHLERRIVAADLQTDFAACLAFLPTRVRLDLGNWPDVFGY